MQNLWKTDDNITGILQKRTIRGKWCHSGNPLSEAVFGRILWAKITDNQGDDFLRMLLKKWLTIFLKKILGSRISLTYKRVMKILRRN